MCWIHLAKVKGARNESSDSVITAGNCHKKDISKKGAMIAERAVSSRYCDMERQGPRLGDSR